ncbi:MAG TPA: tellurite resistance TerB family protein [Rhizomicrobium sp.]|jgi:tellurite resistance protein|nr:tellurite resistance TerB family protein [Rhizomicrobium sp.]
MKAISHHSALIYVMVIVSAADGVMSDRELRTIGDMTKTLPIFRDFEEHYLLPIAQECAAMLCEPDSLDRVLQLIREALPSNLCETAYALALEVALTDSRVMLEEVRVLEILRHALAIDRLVAAALERGARARYQVSTGQ